MRGSALVSTALVLSSMTACSGGGGGPADPDSGVETGDDEPIVPEETADEAALSTLADWRALPVFGRGLYRQQSSSDRGTGDAMGIRLLENGNRDMNNFVCAGEGAEAAGIEIIPMLLDAERCPEDWVRGFVLCRFEGSGRLVRIWMTAMSFDGRGPDEEVLRIYVDDQTEPVLQVPVSTAADGTAGEIFAPPLGAATTRHLSWYYPVVFGSRLIVALDGLAASDFYYHQTVAVLDPEPTDRVANGSRLASRDDVLALLSSPGPPSGRPEAASVTLPPGEAVRALDLAGPATILATRVRVAEATLDALRDVEVSVLWDDRVEPAIELPLSDLFASTLAVPQEGGLVLAGAREAGEVELLLRLPMPFAASAAWTLTNRGVEPLALELSLEVEDRIPEAPFGHLHVQRHETVGPTLDRHPLALASGRGRLVGACLMLEGHGLDDAGLSSGPLNFLEGDERGIIDGVAAIFGTGTEDYLNGAFYFGDGPFVTPFAQVWDVVEDDAEPPGQGRVSGCRWHILGDAIDFASSLELDLEIGPRAPSLLDRYRTVAFLYL